jgi:hypothetical protein
MNSSKDGDVSLSGTVAPAGLNIGPEQKATVNVLWNADLALPPSI